MAEQKLLVKREGDFHYPIYFKNDFQDLAGAIREEGLERPENLYCDRQSCCTSLS